MKNLCLIISIVLVASCHQPVRQFMLNSPDSKITVIIESGDKLSYAVNYMGKPLILPSPVALHLGNGIIVGKNPKISDTATFFVNDTIFPSVKEKRAFIPDHYRELRIRMEDGFELHFRAYNDGVTWRFAITNGNEITILNEEASFRVNDKSMAYYPQITQREDADIFHTSFEENYTGKPLDSIPVQMMAFTPVLVESALVPKVVITESDVNDYPGMFLFRDVNGGLKGRFAGYPLKETVAGGEFKQKIVTQRAEYICRTRGPRTFPWRVIAIAGSDADLLVNDIVYRLAPETSFSDGSWIKPGKSTEEWITGLNLYHVDFKAGLNTATYKYYIDFAVQFGFEYVMLDAGWSDPGDLFKITPSMDMEEITGYAKDKGIGLILWTEAMTFERQMNEALEQFKKWDIKIVMTDFIDRNDQVAINFLHRFAKECADRQFMCMIHGAPIPAGFSRTWPNMLAREAVLGSEYNIWSSRANPEHDLKLPFIRMVSGPMDYEPGIMQNASRSQSAKLGFEKVIAQGTLMHQMAMFVVYESPLQLFSGNLSDAIREPELMALIGKVPTTWDETRIIDAKFGEYIVEARRNGDNWYIAGINSWKAQQFRISLGFLPAGKYNIEIAEDGINADRNPQDYRMKETTIASDGYLDIQLAPGGGFLGVVKKEKGVGSREVGSREVGQ